MRRIRSRNTSPELVVRHAVHAAGLRYRIHRKGMPGRPDLVFPGRRVCVFVHGCFWHGCLRCIDGRRAVKSNKTFWTSKVVGNKERDARHRAALEADGWRVLVIWECEARDKVRIRALIKAIRGTATPRRAQTGRRQEHTNGRRDGEA